MRLNMGLCLALISQLKYSYIYLPPYPKELVLFSCKTILLGNMLLLSMRLFYHCTNLVIGERDAYTKNQGVVSYRNEHLIFHRMFYGVDDVCRYWYSY